MDQYQRRTWDSFNQYIAKQGDTFDDIARQAYGDSHLASILLYVNPDLADRLILDGGELIQIPIIAIAPSETLPPWRTQA